MALTNYQDLVTSVSDWLAAEELVPRVPDFISLAEAQFNRRLRTRDQHTRVTADAAPQFVTLPTDFLELISVQVNTSPPARRQKSTESQLDDLRNANESTGTPTHFAVLGPNLELYKTPSSTTEIEITYYKKVPALTASVPTNFLMTNHPDIYLYGALTAAEPYLGNDDRLATWNALLERGVEELRTADDRAESGNAPLVMRAENRLDYGQWK